MIGHSSPWLTGAVKFRENLDALNDSFHSYDIDLRPIVSVFDGKPFTRSSGSLVSKLYERLTKANRRKAERLHAMDPDLGAFADAAAYRQGVYDAFKTLQKELNDKLS